MSARQAPARGAWLFSRTRCAADWSAAARARPCCNAAPGRNT